MGGVGEVGTRQTSASVKSDFYGFGRNTVGQRWKNKIIFAKVKI